MCWVFVDEHPDALDDGIMYLDPNGSGANAVWNDLVGSIHNGACGFGFADGHAEIHQWHDPTTIIPVTYVPHHQVNCPNSQDYYWMASRTPQR
jgi:prepilin-type processing-associated H-X9-DG protein